MITFTLRIISQVVAGHFSRPKVNASTKAVVIPFRCWPIDIDCFLHMNNAKFLLNAELSRWRTMCNTGALVSRITSKEGMVFLAAENKVKYLRPIAPLQRYVISSTLQFDDEDKWLYYRHTFQEHPDDIKGRDGTAKTFAIVDLKAVVKEQSGKTIKPSVILKESDFYKEWATKRKRV
eukprot:CAMPEP_0204624616 /NCGR_PEP_ID=MMETSP0717-20131115/10368_1 /ASSEMBLY_ACC=CAM_ASM_000666 /TAXON_ID=230516 /ORGANISM="Chaetoceros curvisetus" /LENGTH=177 /DNA_ID=CAMNT_0051640069 /DNA_START=71 /DNA_END=604 /DNA_ORIENTATION=-